MNVFTKCFVLIFVLVLVSLSWTLTASASDSITMRLTTDTPEGMPQGKAAVWFGKEVEKTLPDSQVKVFNGGSLYNNPDSLEAMHAGTLEASWVTLSKVSGIIPQGLALRMPSLFSSYQQVHEIPQTEFGTLIENAASKRGFILLSWGNLSPYIGIGSKDRILNVADWEGKKVRVYEKHTQVAMVKALGGNPIVMPWGEFVPSLQSGVVDAGFTSLSSWGSVKEDIPYFTSIGMVPDYYIFLVAERWWNNLDKETRQVISDVAKEAAKKQRTWQHEKDQKEIEQLAASDPNDPGFYLLSGERLKPYKKQWIEPVRKVIEDKIGPEGQKALDLAIKVSKEVQ